MNNQTTETKITDSEKQKFPEVIYVDPNRDMDLILYGKTNTNDIGMDLIIPPEDLCIAVQLEVSTPQLDSTDTRNAVTVELKTINGEQKVSFFEGKYIGNQYVLTDYYDDISFNSESTIEGGVKEALGIRSINIEYNSWYLPQISMEFVDVRGMSLMNPIDVFKGGNIENAINSFFSAFYTIPYPQFKLLIKGFYGNSVTYDLVAQDIRTTLDTQSGNVIINAQFVGYSFAMFADIPFDWIKSAPYNKYAQDDNYSYWREQIGNGRFTFDEPSKGVPIPTFAELYEIIQTTIRQVKKLSQDDDSAKKKNNLDNAYQHLNDIRNEYNQFKNIILKHIQPYNKSDGSIKNPNLGFDDTEMGMLRIFSTTVVKWFDFFDNGSNLYDNIENTSNNEKVYPILYSKYVNSVLSKIERYNQMVKENDLNIPQLSAPSFDLITKGIYIAVTDDDEYLVKYNLVKFTPYFLYELNYKSFKTQVEYIQENEIEKGRNQSKQDLLNKTYDLVKNSIGFVPTIGNIVKLFFAHFEMFFYNYFSVIEKTKIRKCTDVGAPPEQIDSENDEKPTAMLPPWFGIYTKEDEGSIQCWPGSSKVRNYFKTPDTWKELEEVKFLKYYNESIIEFNKRIEQVEINLSELNEENIWLPINPFDVSNTILVTGIHETNPYKKIIEDSSGIDILNDIIKEVGVRMFYGVGTWDENGSATNLIARSEAKNVYSAISTQQALIERLKRYLDTILTSVELVNIWEGKSENITGGGDKIIERTGNQLLASDENGNSIYTMIEYSFGNNNNGFVIPFSSIGLSHYNVGDQKIIDSDGNNKKFMINEGVPLFYTHSNFHESTWGGKYKVIFNIQPYFESINTFIETIRGKESELVKNWNTTTYEFNNFFIKELKTVGGRNAYTQDNFLETQEDKQGIKYPIYYTNITKDKDKTKFIGNLKDNRNNINPILLDIAPDDKPLFNRNSGLTMDLDKTISSRGNTTGFILPYFSIKDDKGEYISYNIFSDPEYYNLNSVANNDSQSDSNYKKCVVLLWSLGINDKTVYEYLDNNFKFSCLKRLPKIILLFLGAECWANNKKFIFKNKQHNPKINDLKRDIQYILEENFKTWCNEEKTINILDGLELKKNNNVLLTSGNDLKECIENIIDKGNKRELKTPLTEDLFSVFSDNICDTYCGLHFVKGELNLLLDADSISASYLMELMSKDDIVLSTYYSIFDEKDKPQHRSIIIPSAQGYADTFLTELNNLLKKTEQNHTEPDKPNEITNNEEAIYFSKYSQFKKIYDRWISWDNSKFDDWKLERFYDNNRTDSSNPAAITIIDKFYCDISNLLICNLDVIGNIIEDVNNTEMSFLSTISNLFGQHKLLFIPTPNKVGIKTKEELLYAFKPFSYQEMDNMSVQPGYTAIYIGEPAGQPSTGYYGKGRKQKDDTLFINGTLSKTEHNIPSLPPTYGNAKNAGKIPVFCVSYGKQNQGYFKLANITNTNPIVTEQTTRATEDIARKAKSDGTESQHSGQDLYDVYSANAYTVEVEMLGCAKIMPLMYFQLNNVYLFSGAYMIFKMSHNITPGRMITKFTGIKQTFKRMDLTENSFFAQTLIDDSSDKQFTYKTLESKPIENGNLPTKSENRDNIHYYGPGKLVAQISDETTIDYAILKNQKISKYYTLANCVEASSKNKTLAGSWDNAGEDMPEGVYNNLRELMMCVDEVYDYVKSDNGMCKEHSADLISKGFSTDPNDYNIHQESVWRRYDDNDLTWYQTFHGYGSATDIHLLYKGSKASPRHPIYSYIFDFIENKLSNKITELFYEYKGSSRWVHYAWNPSSTKKLINKNYEA